MVFMDQQALDAIAAYVRSRRGALSVAEAARRGGISSRKWHDVERAKGPYRETTLAAIADGLGESPSRLYELAGLPYTETRPGDDVSDRLRRIEEEIAEQRRLLQQLVDAAALLGILQSASPHEPGSTR